jgi:hypothetical protein
MAPGFNRESRASRQKLPQMDQHRRVGYGRRSALKDYSVEEEMDGADRSPAVDANDGAPRLHDRDAKFHSSFHAPLCSAGLQPLVSNDSMINKFRERP